MDSVSEVSSPPTDNEHSSSAASAPPEPARTRRRIPGEYAISKLRAWSDTVTATLDDGKQRNTIRFLDGVRGLSCIGIIVFHLNLFALNKDLWRPSLPGIGGVLSSLGIFGEAGVLLFFILSSFLLFMPFARALLFDTTWPSWQRFYIRRIFRIVPCYYLALFLMVLFFNPGYLQTEVLPQLGYFLTFCMQFPSVYKQINVPFWTLAVEFQYYMLLPLLSLLMQPIVHRGPLNWRLAKLTFCLLILMGWGLGTHYWGNSIINRTNSNWLIPYKTALALKPIIYGGDGNFYEVFALGMLLSMAYVYISTTPQQARVVQIAKRLSPFICLCGMCVLLFMSAWHFYVLYAGVTLHFLDPFQGQLLKYGHIGWPIGCGLGFALCLFAMLSGKSWLQRPFTWAPLRWAGLLSYNMYIWHYLFIEIFLQMVLPNFKDLDWSTFAISCVFWLWTFGCTVPLAIGLYRTLEVPCIRLGERLCLHIERTKQDSTPPGNNKERVDKGQEPTKPKEGQVLIAAGRGHQTTSIE